MEFRSYLLRSLHPLKPLRPRTLTPEPLNPKPEPEEGFQPILVVNDNLEP